MQRTLGLGAATSLGIGAIVGGGILALAGVAFAATGPGALAAFAFNGVIALLTALSFAEMSAAFPESGGTYTFAKRFLSTRIAFAVGWVVWFASLVAAVLYALGFGSFTSLCLREALPETLPHAWAWLESRWVQTVLAMAATGVFAGGLLRRGAGGGRWINLAKLAVFALLIAGGLWALRRASGAVVIRHLRPFFPGGTAGLFQAMGFTFIALQGFDLIAAVAGEVRDPARNIPRAMIFSLLAALGIYLPLLFVVCTAGVEPGQSMVELGREQPEAVVAIAARRFLGELGYWLVLAAGILSMLSALQANLFAASRVAFAMGRDRTLAPVLRQLDPHDGIPRLAVAVVTGIVLLILLLVPDVATAGAASSLIFLITFFLAHVINLLLHRRADNSTLPFRAPLYPLVPVLGGLSCLALAVYQGLAVPTAGLIALGWLALGGGLYSVRFSRRARVFDASAEAIDPLLMKYRGRNPLVLVPMRNASNAGTLVAVASAISAPGVSRVMLMTVVRPPNAWKAGEEPENLVAAQAVLRQAMTASFAAGLAPEALMSVSANHWEEIRRVARLHRCESVLLGLRNVNDQTADPQFDRLLSTLPCDVVVLRAAGGWNLDKTRHILVPVGGRGLHSPLRARLLGSLRRRFRAQTTYLSVLASSASQVDVERARQQLRICVEDEVAGEAEIIVESHADLAGQIIQRATDQDLIVLGLQQSERRQRMIGELVLRIARGTQCALVILGHKPQA